MAKWKNLSLQSSFIGLLEKIKDRRKTASFCTKIIHRGASRLGLVSHSQNLTIYPNSFAGDSSLDCQVMLYYVSVGVVEVIF